MAINYWWRPYDWQSNSKTAEASALSDLRESLLKVLNESL